MSDKCVVPHECLWDLKYFEGTYFASILGRVFIDRVVMHPLIMICLVGGLNVLFIIAGRVSI